ncbi:MAG: hypothetical protein QXR89_04770 [Candidatus Bathyarchaeia archaeon]
MLALVIRLLFILDGLSQIAIGSYYWVNKEKASKESPVHYWFWFSSGPYIRSAKERVEHVAFKGKVLLACGIPLLLIGIFSPDTFFNLINVIGVGVLMLLAWILHLIFIADAVDRDKYATDGVSQEEIEQIRERD